MPTIPQTNIKKTLLVGRSARGGDVEIEVEYRDGRFSMSGKVWDRNRGDIESGGQNLDHIKADIKTLLIPEAQLDRMLEIWQRWHLNDMQPGCEHQRAQAAKPAISEPCPVCGYKYGTAWLKEDVPEDVLAEVASWQNGPEATKGPTFAERHGLTMSSVKVEQNPNNPEWTDANHYEITLRRRDDQRRKLTVYFSMGYGHTRGPKIMQVLHSLATDAASVDNARSFEDWASDLGYDTDSRTADRTYKTCVRQAAKLKTFLGDAAYAELVNP
jgi:hypothetical protein